MIKFIFNLLILYFGVFAYASCSEKFDDWLKKFQVKAIKSGISEQVVNEVMSEAKFLPKVIEMIDISEFYEDTFTYIKREHQIVKLKKV